MNNHQQRKNRRGDRGGVGAGVRRHRGLPQGGARHGWPACRPCSDARPHQWFAKDPVFDQLLQQRFVALTRRAIAAELDAWGIDETGDLALVLLLDQFLRQMCRNTALAFAGDQQGGNTPS